MIDSDKLLDSMEQVVSQTNRAGKIIRRIRNLVKRHEPHLSSVGINDTIRDIIDIYEAQAKQNRVIMQTKLARNVPLIQADRIALEQALLNLVKNSFEAMGDVEPERRRLTVETSMPAEDEIEVVVRDTGKGLT